MNPNVSRPAVNAVRGALLAASVFAVATSARADDEIEVAQPTDLDSAVQSTIFQHDFVSNLYDDVQKWKKDSDIPIEVGAWHWWHMNRNSPHDFHYGLPTLGGTYYYYIHADPQTDGEDGMKMGAHIDLRLRDGEESFRPFFDSNAWLWEAYAWLEVDGDKFKLGKIWKRFGLDWDGCWYGNVQYFDGYKLDPDWGASWERTCEVNKSLKVPSFLQVFYGEDMVNGSIGGADSESDPRSREALSTVARMVPTWAFDDGTSLALGVSGTIGNIKVRDESTHGVSAGAVDLTYTNGPIKGFAEYLHEVGERNPTNYVTGGPSDRADDWLLGGSYTHGFASFRAIVSHGRYQNPGGEQVLYLTGVTLAITKNVDLYIEYVRWDTKSGAGRVPFEDGFNFIINWRF